MNPDTYVAPVFTKFLDMVQRHVKYIISTSRYVENLRKKRAVLNARKEDMDGKIEEAERRSQRPNNELVVWQRQVVETLDKIDAVISSAQESRSCVCAICSDYKTGHRCDDMLQEVNELLERKFVPESSYVNVLLERKFVPESSYVNELLERKFVPESSYVNAEMVDCDNSNVPISMSYVVPESQESYFAEALKYIEDDNSKKNIIGICGPGGVGKTALLTKIHNSYLETPSMFKHIIWIVASSEQSNISKIQSEIIKNLRLNESDDAQLQVRSIHNFLATKNFLLFIDDLWEAVDLLKVGVPNPFEADQYGKKRKVLFTTRSMDVCGNMDAKNIIEVKCLEQTQSWTLFKEKVGDDIVSDDRITEFAKGVAEECKGLPLALITIGRAMSTKRNPGDWKFALNQLKNSQVDHFSYADKQLLRILKLSYDYLASDQLRKCFLSISMWPEDFSISKNELIEFWMGQDFINNFESRHEAYQIGHSLIGSLQAVCLLEDDKVDEKHIYFLRHVKRNVKMHDIIRDLALWIASDCGKNKNKWMVKAGIELKEVPKVQVKWSEAECISLMRNHLKGLPSDIPNCPNLLTLVLSHNALRFGSNLTCFGKFHSLTYLDLSFNLLRSFPELICDLTELQYLNLSHNRIIDLPMKLRNLKKLKYLILRENRIRNIPTGVFSELPKLLVLDMYCWKYVFGNPYFVDLEELKSIEKTLIYFGTTVRSEEELSKLMLLSELFIEDLCIEGLHDRVFHFTSIIRNPHHLKDLCIRERINSRLWEIVFDKNEIYQDITSLNLETLLLDDLKNLKRIIWKDITPKNLFAELRKVLINGCEVLEDITWVIHLPSLTYLKISGCNSMRIAINNNVDTQLSTFPSLEHLCFYSLDKLEKIYVGPLAFPQLKVLQVDGCPLLKTLPFDFKTAPKLTQIEGLEEWWEKLEWEDDNSTSHFNQFFVELEWEDELEREDDISN